MTENGSSVNYPALFCVPTAVQFGRDLMNEIPFPTLRPYVASCMGEDDSEIGLTGKNNLIQDKTHKNEILHLYNSDDSELVKAVYEAMEAGDARYVNPNLNSAVLTSSDLTDESLGASILLQSITKYEREKKRNVLQTKPFDFTASPTKKVEAKNTTQEDGPSTPVRSRAAKKNKKRRSSIPKDDSEQNTHEPAPKKISSLKLDEADTELDIDRFIGEIDEFFAWSDFRKIEEVPTDQQLEKLRAEVKFANNKGFMSEIDSAVLTKLINFFGMEVRRSEEHLQGTEVTKESIKENLEAIQTSLTCAIIALDVMTSKRSNTDLIVEDCVEAILEFAKQVAHKFIFPTVQKEEDEIKVKHPKKTSENEHSIDDFIYQYNMLLDLFLKLLKNLKLRDEWVLGLADVSLGSFFVDGLGKVQLISLKIISWVFAKYKAHRESIIRDIITSILKLPNNSTSTKNYRVGNGQSIQVFTSLILQLLQSCATVPYGNTSENIMDTSEDGEDETKIEPATDDNMKDFYSESYSCCKILVEFMLDRCTQESIAGENNKVIITHFVDDLLVTLDRPEYPATDMVLNIMVLTLAKNYLKSDKPDPVRIMAIQILATIATRAIDDTSLNSSNVAKLVEDYNISGSEDEESRYESISHANLFSASFASSQDSTPKNKKKKRRSKRVQSPTYDLRAEFEDVFLLNQTDRNKFKVFAYLSYVAAMEDNICPRQYLLCQWMHDDNGEKDKMYLRLWKKEPQEYLERKPSNEDVENAYLFIACERKDSVIRKYDQILNHIINLMEDDKVKVRSKAIKSLQVIIEKDPTVKDKPFVQAAVHQHLNDQSPLVRENILDFIGRIITSANVNKFYLKMVLTGVKDPAKSVRKRSINILGDLSTKNDTKPEIVSEICGVLATRLNVNIDEEENIRDLVLKNFEALWFEANTSSKLKESVLQIVDVISLRQVSIFELNEHWLVGILKKTLAKEGTREKHIKSMKMMTLKLLGHMAEIDQTNSDGEGRYNLTQCMLAVNLFCIAEPELVSNQLTNLLTYVNENYLKRDPPKSTMIFYVTSIVDMLLNVTKPSTKDAETLYSNLNRLLTQAPKMSKEAMSSTARCWCNLAERNKLQPKLANALVYLYNTAHTNLVEGQMMRILNVIGLLVQYFDFDALQPSDFNQELLKKSKLQPGSIIQSVWTLFVSNLSHKSNNVVQGATKGLGSLLIRNPKLFATETSIKIVSALLKKTGAPLVHKAMLENMRDFLISEEKRMQSEGTTGDNVDTGVTTSFMTTYIEPILSLVYSQDQTVRFSALEVLELVLKQGLYIPPRIIPKIITLLADPCKLNKERAYQIMTYVVDRFRDLAITHAAEGVAQSFNFLISISNDKNSIISGTDSEKRSHFSKFFELTTTFTRRERTSILDSIVLQLQKATSARMTYYLAEVLAYLSYNHLYEVLNVIIKISKEVDTKGDEIVSTLRATVKDEVPGIQEAAKHGAQLVLLIRLRRLLQEVYTLNDKKCEDYLDDEKSKAYEKQAIPRENTRVQFKFSEMDKLLSHIDTDEEHAKDLYKLVKQEHHDHITHSFDVTKGGPKKRKGPAKKTSPQKDTSPPKRGRGRARGGGAKRGRKRKREDSEDEASSDEEEDEDVWHSDQSEDEEQSEEEENDSDESPEKKKRAAKRRRK